MILNYILPFLILILVVVFIHEYGHFYFARKYGVGVTDFSIGFGKELIGWNDKLGTRWKICAIPLGGYVKFFGDRNVYSQSDHQEILEKYNEEEREKLFILKPLYQRVLIVFGGPLANFLLALVIFFSIYTFVGKDFTPAVINEVQKDSPAMMGGLKIQDVILEIDGNEVKSIMEVSKFITMSTGDIIDFKVNFKSAYGDENDASTTDDNKNEENSSSSSSSSSSGLKGSAENIDNNIDNNNNNNDEIKSEYPPHLTINKSQEAFTNALRVEQPSVIFKNAKTRIMQNSKVSLLALEDLQENSIQAWRNDIESAFINVTVTDIIDDENDYNNNTLIHEEEEHQENNATKKTPSFVEHVESFYEANEENVKKAGFAAAVALFLLLVYCFWKRLRRRRIGRGGTSRGGKSAAEKNTREGREEEEEKEDNAEERE